MTPHRNNLAGVITFVFTDIEGYSTLEEHCGDLLQPVLEEHNRLLRHVATEHGGVEVKTIGDAFFLAFSHAANAVEFTVAAQRALQEFPWQSAFPRSAEVVQEIRVRMGMHSGEARAVTHPDGQFDYFGSAVNRAARVSSAAHGAQVLLSETTRSLAQNALSSDIQFLDLGLHRLKGVGEERLWQIHVDGLLHEFPPLHTLTAQRHNLPLPLTPFLGREKELREWKEILLSPGTRMLTITGFGGMGKTRLSLRIAEDCYGAFADGVWWVPLEHASDGDDMLRRIAEQLIKNLKPLPGVSDQIREFCRDRELLLVLDNLEQITPAEVAQELMGLLDAAPRIKILATSRRAVEIAAEKLVELEPFATSEAESLFAERASSRKAGFEVNSSNATEIRAICDKLEGVPLAIEIAASRVALLSPRQILQRLDDQLKLLVARDPSLPPRHAALRGAVEWSHNLLGEDAKVLFPQLSVFTGGFTIDAAEGIVHAESTFLDVLDGLMELRNQSLLRGIAVPGLDEERLVMLESVREYAAEKLTDTDAHRRHADYYCNWLQEQVKSLRTAEEAAAINAMNQELDNLRTALQWSESAHQYQLTAAIALELGHFLERRGLFKESQLCAEKGLEAVAYLPQDDAAVKILHASLLRERASAHINQQEWEKAQHLANLSRTLFDECGDMAGKASALNQLGVVACRIKEFAAARQHLEQAEGAYLDSGDASGQAIVWHNLGLTASESGDMALATEYLERALQLRREHGDQRGLSETLNNLGVVAQEQNQLQQAWDYYRHSLDCEVELQNAFGVGRAFYNLGEIAELQHNSSRAWRLFAAAEHLFYESGSPYRQFAMDAKHRISDQHQETLSASLSSDNLSEFTHWALQENNQ